MQRMPPRRVPDLLGERWWIGAVAFVVVSAVAYSYTLSSFVDYLRLDTPLAYLPLMPAFAIGIAWMAVRRSHPKAPSGEGHELDFWLGVPLLLVALLMITLMPVFWSTFYWIDRIDVISFALFVCGAVTLLYGVAWLWRLRAAILLLFLMWPALYIQALPKALDLTTTATNSVVGALVASVPIGVSRGADPSLLTINTRNGTSLIVALGTACSGANAVFGFILIGSVVASTLRGSLVRKLAWLFVGTGLAFVGNLLRLISILALAAVGQPSFALGAYHEFIGLVVFTTVVISALILSRNFGLRFSEPKRPSNQTYARTWPRPIGHRLPSLAVTVFLLAVVCVTAVADRDLGRYATWITNDGRAAAQPFSSGTLPQGWTVQHLNSYSWAGQYFGLGSDFDRYVVVADNQMVVADVVRTRDAGSLNTFTLEACFLFHSFSIRRSTRTDLGHGVTAVLLDYDDPASGKRWATVSWAWPVREGSGMRYERIALTSDLLRGSAVPPVASPSDGLARPILWLSSGILDVHKNGSDPSFDAVNARIEGLATALVAVTSQ